MSLFISKWEIILPCTLQIREEKFGLSAYSAAF